MTTVADAFARARAADRAALIAYLPAGFPDHATSVRIIEAMIDAGVDMVEVGIPYSDPLMDGPVICAAAEQALQQGTTTDDALDVVAAVAGRGAAIVMMTYWNLIDRYGPRRFADRLAAAGGAGVITPDLTPEEGVDWVAACDDRGLAHVFLAAPSSTDDRLAVVASATSGFVYAASLMGVTGVQQAVGSQAADLVERLRRVTATPIAVGIGVSTAAQAHDVSQFADGVIVGSAFVRRVLEATDADAAVAAVGQFSRELVAGVARHSR
ncbi:MAG: tryptophan synthase subunit alpha [Candidatus Nanopelagicales bacterium]